LTHIDESLTIRPDVGEDELAILDATAFSTKLSDILILEHDGTLEYTKLKGRSPGDNEEGCEGCIEMAVAPLVIICVLLGLFLILSIILGFCLYQQKGTTTNEVGGSSQNFAKEPNEKIQSELKI
jgi:hypothetical protein